MANPYFRQVPNFEYVNRTAGADDISNFINVKNLFKRGKLRSDIFGNVNFFTKYKVIGDERPDNVAFKLYQDPTLDWVVLLSNNIINIMALNAREIGLDYPYSEVRSAINAILSQLYHSNLKAGAEWPEIINPLRVVGRKDEVSIQPNIPIETEQVSEEVVRT